ncbi:hypothetical protein CR513_08114, partial [Mucuna pruriens]
RDQAGSSLPRSSRLCLYQERLGQYREESSSKRLKKKTIIRGQSLHLYTKKCRDPRIFSVPCTIGRYTFIDAMLDPGASIDVMPASLYKSLNFGDLEPIGAVIQLANRSVVQPVGILEDVLVQVNDLIFSIDFYVLEMEDEMFGKGSTLILGRPFLMTTRKKIDVHAWTSSIEFGDNLVQFISLTNSFPQQSPPDELKPLLEHLKYAYLDQDQQFPEQEENLLTVLQQHKKSIRWKLLDLPRINPSICMHRIRMEEEAHVVKKEVTRLLAAGINYPISDSNWVVPKKSGMTVTKNQHDEMVSTRIQNSWRLCINYKKLNQATCKDNFPLSFLDQILEKLAGKSHYCFLDGYSRYMQIHISPEDQHKTTFTCPFGTFAYTRMPFGLCNAPSTF